MRLLPVLDLLDGHVVHGIGGLRDSYRSIRSQLSRDTSPLAMAQALRTHFGCREFYVADLDAIQGGEPAWSTYQVLLEAGFRLWIDAGTHDTERARRLVNLSNEAGRVSVIAGLESLATPQQLTAILAVVGPERTVFSLDLKHGVPLRTSEAWPAEPLDILRHVHELGVRRLILLDLAAVGKGQGVPTIELAQAARQLDNDWQLTTGGGVRHLDDLRALVRVADYVLVASALHDGRLTRAALAEAGLLDDTLA